MPDVDTRWGGEGREFPATTWSVIARIKKGEGLAELSRRFWKPVYHYIRIAWKKSNEDAKDLSQAFFLWLVEGDALSKYEPGRGGFRAYLKLVLKHFIANHEQALARLKRGGHVQLVPIEDDTVPDTDDPERALDRAWLKSVLERAVERTRRRFADRPAMWAAYERYELSGVRRTYADVAKALGIKEGDVRNYLFAVREELRREIMAELADTVDGDPEQEYRDLFG